MRHVAKTWPIRHRPPGIIAAYPWGMARGKEQFFACAIDSEKMGDGFLLPERRRRFVVARVRPPGEILEWGELPSKPQALNAAKGLSSGLIPQHEVWHRKFLEKHQAQLDRFQFSQELAFSLAEAMPASAIVGIFLDATQATRQDKFGEEVPDHKVRMEATRQILELMGLDQQQLAHPQKSEKRLKAEEAFLQSEFFQRWQAQQLEKIVMGTEVPKMLEESSDSSGNCSKADLQTGEEGETEPHEYPIRDSEVADG